MPAPFELAGRWSLVRSARVSLDIAGANDAKAATAVSLRRRTVAPDVLEHIAHTLLRRYGVVFWRLLEREPGWLPPWREWLPVLHRMEARGDVRGGRFVAGLAGEQFALPEAIPLLRETRRRPPDGELVKLSAVDPLNLCGTLLPGEKVPALPGNHILFRDGLPVATWIAKKPHYDDSLSGAERENLLQSLIGPSRLTEPSRRDAAHDPA